MWLLKLLQRSRTLPLPRGDRAERWRSSLELIPKMLQGTLRTRGHSRGPVKLSCRFFRGVDRGQSWNNERCT